MSSYSLETPEGKARLAARLADLGHIKQPWAPEQQREIKWGRALNAAMVAAYEDMDVALGCPGEQEEEQDMEQELFPEEIVHVGPEKVVLDKPPPAPKRKRRTKAEMAAAGAEAPGVPDRLKAEFCDFRSPQPLFDLAMAVFGDAIALDPFTDETNPAGAERFFTPTGGGRGAANEDGHIQEWDARNVYMNPRFGEYLEPALRKFAHQVCRRKLPAMLVLPSNRLETQYWQHYVWGARPVALWQSIGKVSFLAPCGTGKGAIRHGQPNCPCGNYLALPVPWIPQTNNNYGTTCWFYNVDPREVLANADCHLPGSAVALGDIRLGKKSLEYNDGDIPF